jgi:hypothetical protein
MENLVMVERLDLLINGEETEEGTEFSVRFKNPPGREKIGRVLYSIYKEISKWSEADKEE